MTEIRVIDGISRTTGAMNGQQGDRGQGFSRTNSDVSFSKQMAEPRQKDFSRVDLTGEAGSAQMQGVRTETELLQGYQGADDQDLDEYSFLVTMEHDAVLNGIQTLQGKKKRAERKAARAEKKQARQQGKAKPTVRPGKAARKQKRAERRAIKTGKKAARLAKKEEKVLMRKTKREQRELDKIARRDRKGKRGQLVKDIFSDLGEKTKDIFKNIVSDPDQFDVSLSDMNIPDAARDEMLPIFDRWREMEPEDVLDEREEFLSERGQVEDAGEGADSAVSDEDKKSGFSMLLPVAVVAVVAMTGKKKKGKKK